MEDKSIKYKQVLLPMVVMFCILTANIKMVPIEYCSLGKYRVGFLQAFGHIFINLSIHNFFSYIFICLKDTDLIHIFDSLTLNSWPTADLSNTCILSMPHSPVLLHWGTILVNSNSALPLADVLSSKISDKRHKNVKCVALDKQWKEHLLIIWELKQEGKAWPCPP